MDKVLNVAYLGDAVYELYIRDFLLTLNIANSGDLQKRSLDYVSARSQRRHHQTTARTGSIMGRKKVGK